MGITRRGLLAGAGATGTLVLLGGRWTAVPAGEAATAATAPADPATAVLAAYVSTLVPGPGDDPEGTPGAVDAGAIEQLQAQAPYVIPLVVADVSAAALAAHGRAFAALPYPDREALLVDAFADGSRAPYHLIAMAVGAGTFYGDFRNRVGGTHLGFPGPSDGYLATYTDRSGHGQPQAEAVPP
jgi:hypothetical protein